MRFIGTADWQLGMTASFLGDEARPRFHQARLDAVKRIGTLATERDAAFVVVCGDVFESNQLDRVILARAFEVLRSFPVPVVLLPGNHDPLDAASIYDAPEFALRVPENVHVLRDDSPYVVASGVEIVGAPWFTKRPLTDLVAQACKPLDIVPPGIVRVVAGHGAVSSLNPDRTDAGAVDLATLQEALESGRAHVAVLGDRHSTTEVAPRIWYPGTPEVTRRRESDAGNVLVVDVDDASHEVHVEAVGIGAWKFIDLSERVDSSEDVERLSERLRSIADKENTAVWLALEGTLTIAAKARLDGILSDAAEVFARLDYWGSHTDLAVIPDDHDFGDLGLSGFAESALAELAELSRGDLDDTSVAQDALGLLYRFAGGGR